MQNVLNSDTVHLIVHRISNNFSLSRNVTRESNRLLHDKTTSPGRLAQIVRTRQLGLVRGLYRVCAPLVTRRGPLWFTEEERKGAHGPDERMGVTAAWWAGDQARLYTNGNRVARVLCCWLHCFHCLVLFLLLLWPAESQSRALLLPWSSFRFWSGCLLLWRKRNVSSSEV